MATIPPEEDIILYFECDLLLLLGQVSLLGDATAMLKVKLSFDDDDIGTHAPLFFLLLASSVSIDEARVCGVEIVCD